MWADPILTISRRRFLATSGAAVATGLLPLGARAQPRTPGAVPLIRKEAAQARIEVQPIRGGISVLMGSGGNIAVLPGRDGKLLVDAGIEVSRPRIAEVLAALSPDPIRHLVNTHWHFDHTGGTEWLHAEGARIVAHENTRRRMAVATEVEGWEFVFPPSPEGALPSEVFATDKTVTLNGTDIVLKYYGPAHTDSDIAVHFGAADVLHVGDTWWNSFYPFIDASTGGSIDGMIRATEDNLARASERTIIIPGHGPVGTRSQLAEFRDMLAAIRVNVANLKRAGRTLDETIAARPTAAFDARWGTFVITPAVFTRLVYDGV